MGGGGRHWDGCGGKGDRLQRHLHLDIILIPWREVSVEAALRRHTTSLCSHARTMGQMELQRNSVRLMSCVRPIRSSERPRGPALHYYWLQLQIR